MTLTTVGYGDMYPKTDGGRAVTSAAIVCGVLFTAMPLTIVGNNFANVWQEKESIRVVLKLQELLVARQLKAPDVMLVFDEFDLDHNGACHALPAPQPTTARQPRIPFPGAGSLDMTEFKAALEVLGVGLAQDKMHHVFNFFDLDGNNQIDGDCPDHALRNVLAPLLLRYDVRAFAAAMEFIQIVFPGIADSNVGDMLQEATTNPGAPVGPLDAPASRSCLFEAALETRASRLRNLKKRRSVIEGHSSIDEEAVGSRYSRSARSSLGSVGNLMSSIGTQMRGGSIPRTPGRNTDSRSTESSSTATEEESSVANHVCRCSSATAEGSLRPGQRSHAAAAGSEEGGGMLHTLRRDLSRQLLHTVDPDTRSLEELLSDARERAQQLHRGKESEVSKQTRLDRLAERMEQLEACVKPLIHELALVRETEAKIYNELSSLRELLLANQAIAPAEGAAADPPASATASGTPEVTARIAPQESEPQAVQRDWVVREEAARVSPPQRHISGKLRRTVQLEKSPCSSGKLHQASP